MTQPKTEELDERNDRLIISKQDGGETIVEDVTTKYGSIRSESAKVDMPLRPKIPVFEPTRHGFPPEQKRTTYFVDDDGPDPMDDDYYINVELERILATHARGSRLKSGLGKFAESIKNPVLAFFGIAFILFAVVGAPYCGFAMGTGEVPPEPSIPIERSIDDGN